MARKLADWLKAYIEYNAFNEAPDHFHFWTGVGVIAGALRRKVWLDMGYFQWTPNFYIILVAPPGIATKSTSIGTGQRFLSEVPGVHFGPAAMTWQALIQSLNEASEEVQIGEMFSAQSCLTFFISELGTCINFADRMLIDTLVDLWDGRDGIWDRRTLTRGKEGAINPWLNIIGCTTPVWIAENIPRRTVAGGFSARCVWVYGDSKKAFVPYPKLVLPKLNETLRQALIHDLLEISTLKGEFTLTPEAIEYGSEWYERNARSLGTSSELINGFRARAQTHVHKLAMVISASKRDDLVITKEDLEAAVKITQTVEPGMAEVFKSVYTAPTMETANDLVKVITARGKIRRSELYQQFFHRMTAKEFSELVDSGISAGLIHMVSSGSTVWLVAGPGIGQESP